MHHFGQAWQGPAAPRGHKDDKDDDDEEEEVQVSNGMHTAWAFASLTICPALLIGGLLSAFPAHCPTAMLGRLPLTAGLGFYSFYPAAAAS